VDAPTIEFGYNTDQRPFTADNPDIAGNTAQFCRSIAVNSAAVVTINGVAYHEFVLDLNQTGSQPFISLDDLKVFLGNAPNLTGSGAGPVPNFGANATQIYDMQSGPDGASTVLMQDFFTGSGKAEYFVDIPVADFTLNGTMPNLPNTNPFIYLYCHFGAFTGTGSTGNTTWTAVDGYEEWAVENGPFLSTISTTIHEVTPTAMALPNPGTVPAGATVQDTALVTPGAGSTGTPSGTVTYEFFTTIDGTGSHTDQVVTLSGGLVPNSSVHGPLAAGSYSFVAVYSGDGNFAPSTSAPEALTVLAAPTTATVIKDSSNMPITNPVALGTTVHDTSTVTPVTPGGPTPTGTVTYEFFMTIDGTGSHTDQVVTLSGGVVPDSSTHGPLMAGSYSFIAIYSGDPNYAGSTSAVEPLTVSKGSSTSATVIKNASNTAITNPVALGTTVHDTATVTTTPNPFAATGTVTYEFFTTIDGTGSHTDQVVTLAGGVVPDSSPHGPLMAGSYSFIAVYSGDSNYTGSTSAVEPLTVSKGSSTTATLIKDASNTAITNPVALGTTVHDTATVTTTPNPFTATGTVTYEFFTTIDGTGSHTDQVVTLTGGMVPDSSPHGPLMAGSYSFIAVYSGDGNYTGSTSTVEPLTVSKGSSTTATVIKDASNTAITNPVALGTTVHDTATVTTTPNPFAATGTVTYEFFTTIDGTGSHTDQVVTLTGGMVPDSSPHGPLAAGSYSFIAVYSGDGNYTGSTSTVEPLTVSKGSSTTATVIKDASNTAITNPVALGTTVHDTATVTTTPNPFAATGTVTYEFFTTIDGTGSHTDQVVTLTGGMVPDSSPHGPLMAGSYSFIAVYSGDSNYTGSTSAVEPLTVSKGSSTTATVIKDATNTAITNPVALGTTVHDTATVTTTPNPFAATGTVTYEFFTTIDGTGSHTDQVVTLTGGMVPDSSPHGPLAAGSYSFIAVYSGDSNYTGSTSAVEPLTVSKGSSTTATVIKDASNTAITNPVALGTTVHDTATVTTTPNPFAATGTVTYEFFTTIDGTGSHVDQVVTLSGGMVPDSSPHGPLAAGSYSFIAVYSGDNNYTGSTSAVEPLVVGKSLSNTATVIEDATNTPITNPVALGTTVHDTSTVTAVTPGGPAPTGTVTYEFFMTIDGTGSHTDQVVTLAGGVVPDSSAHGPLTAGSYSFIAVYSGDSNYGGSISAVEPLTVSKGSSTTATVIKDASNTAITNPVALGTTVHDTATVTTTPNPFAATGTVTYEFFTTIDGTGSHTDQVVTLAGGVVPDSSPHGPLMAGSYSFIAVYSGDSNYTGSTSAVEPLTVSKGSSTTATVIKDASNTAITNPVALGTTVHDTATVTTTPNPFTATGTVTYEFFTTIDGTGLHTDEVVTLSGGVVPDSSPHGPLAAGSYSFIAVYSGDSNYTGSTSAVEPLTVSKGSSDTATQIINASNTPIVNPVPLGTIVRDTATVTGSSSIAPTGTITYEFFTTIDGTGSHTDQVEALGAKGVVPDSSPHGPLTAGSYSFIAIYGGDSNYAGSISAVEPLTVSQRGSSTATVIEDSTNTPISNPVTLGTTVHDTATVTVSSGLPTPTGTVTYEFFTTIDGTGSHTDQVVTLANGVVPDSSPHGPLTAGSYSFIAVYSGDTNYTGSTSTVEPLMVSKGSSTTATVIKDASNTAITNPVALGTTVHDTATVTTTPNPFAATGTVTYEFFTTIDGTGSHTDQVVTLTGGMVPDSSPHGPLAAGSYSFIAVYSGDSNYTGSTSAVEPLTVSKGSSTTATVIKDATNTAITNPVALGITVHDTATVTTTPNPFAATGTVTYEFFTTIDGTGSHTDQVVTLSGGMVPDSSPHGPLAAGSYSFIAVYSGDSNYTGSTSAVEPLTVSKGTSSTATVIKDSTNTPIAGPVPLGTTVHDTSTVTGSSSIAATGTVTYEFFTTIDGTGSHTDQVVTLSGGVVPDSSPHGPLTAGSYSFIAVYSGDSNYAGSTSAVEPLTVSQRGSTTATVIEDSTNTPITNPVTLGTTVHDTATVTVSSGLPTPTGTVTYEFFTTIDGTGSHTDQVVTLANGLVPDSSAHGPLMAGSYSFIAIYSGDSNYSGSTSAVEPLTVSKGSSTTATVIKDATNTAITNPEIAGTTVHDTATVTTTPNPFTATGTVTYEFFRTIDGTGLHTDEVVTLSGGMVPDSSPHGPLSSGSYSFIAIYSGDSNYAGSTSAVEPLTVTQASPDIFTTPGGPIVLGSGARLKDAATLSGGFNLTGTITFTLFAPDGTTVVDTETVAVNGKGTYDTTTGFLPTGVGPLTGTYEWVVRYNGDANNNPVTSPKGDEPATVKAASPAINTTPGPTVVLGSGAKLTDSATLSGGFNPTGTITFTLFAPNGTTVVDTETVTVNGAGTYSTPNGFLPTAAGTYQWVASYSGDQNDNPVTSPKGDEPQTVVAQTQPGQIIVEKTTNPAASTQAFTFVSTYGSSFSLMNGQSNTSAPLAPGVYTVTEQVPTGWVLSNLTFTDPDGDSSQSGNSAIIQLDPGETVVAHFTDTMTSFTLPDVIGKINLLGSQIIAGAEGNLVNQAAFVNQLYHDILGRVPTVQDVNQWTTLLQAGVSRQQVATAFWESPEHRGLQVDAFYQQFLHRAPDAAGRSGWVNAFLSGADEISVAVGFLTSAEYTSSHASNASFVNGVYQDVLGRAPSAAEALAWQQALQSGVTRATVASDILTSVEGFSRIVTQDYQSFLHRAPSPAERQTWVSALQGGQASEESLAVTILASDEFFTNPTVSFVTDLFHDVLNRSATAGELNQWTAALYAGTVSQQQVATAFWLSPEHRGIEVDGYYQTFLHRTSDPAGRAGWVNAFLSGADEASVISGFLTSGEYLAAHASNASFVKGLYTDLLGRTPSATEELGWEQALQSGTTRGAMAGAFVNSPEEDLRVVDLLYQDLLLRSPSMQEEQTALGALQSGQVSRETLAEALLASTEYFSRGLD
jgi:hypothetical protein